MVLDMTNYPDSVQIRGIHSSASTQILRTPLEREIGCECSLCVCV